MILKNRINEITPNEKIRLKGLINDFIGEFASNGQSETATDFKRLLISKEITLRILCKLSEWCNTPDIGNRIEGKKRAKEISQILFGDVVPKLDGRLVTIKDEKIEFNL